MSTLYILATIATVFIICSIISISLALSQPNIHPLPFKLLQQSPWRIFSPNLHSPQVHTHYYQHDLNKGRTGYAIPD